MNFLKKHKSLLVFLAVIVACLIVHLAPHTERVANGTVQFHFIDVGQGDCELIRTENHSILIDAGTTDSRFVLVEYLKQNVEKLDLMIITHPHEDHMGGAVEVLRTVPVDRVAVIDEVTNEAFFLKLLYEIEQRKRTLVTVNDESEYSFDGLKLSFFVPKSDGGADMNEKSAVVRCDFGKTSALFTGDLSEKAEKSLILEYPEGSFDCDLLKVSHHGSAYSSCRAFVEAVSPELAVIEVGADNTFGHPSARAMERLTECGVEEIFRTDKDGTVVFVSDGEKLERYSPLNERIRIFE